MPVIVRLFSSNGRQWGRKNLRRSITAREKESNTEEEHEGKGRYQQRQIRAKKRGCQVRESIFLAGQEVD